MFLHVFLFRFLPHCSWCLWFWLRKRRKMTPKEWDQQQQQHQWRNKKNRSSKKSNDWSNSSRESSASTEKLLNRLEMKHLFSIYFVFICFASCQAYQCAVFFSLVVVGCCCCWFDTLAGLSIQITKSLTHARIHAPTKIENDEILMAVFSLFWLSIVVSRTK